MGLFDLFRRHPPTEAQFAKLFISRLRRAGYGGDVTLDLQRFALKLPGPQSVNLRNFYVDYCNHDKAVRETWLEQAVRGIATPPDSDEDLDSARPQLRPKVWSRAAFELTKLQLRLDGGGLDKMGMPQYPLGEHLIVSLALDLPHAIKSVNEDDLERWGISYYEAMEIARENLEQTESTIAKIGDGLYASCTGDNYDSSRILLTDKVRSLPVKGDHIAMVANRDTLLVTGSEDLEGLRIMAEIAEKTLREESRPMSGVPLRLIEDEWEDWNVPEQHRLFEQFHRLELQMLGDEYAGQKDLLDAIHVKDETNLFVATLMIAEENDTQRLVSHAVWTDDVDTLLPQADFVALVERRSGIVAGHSWARVTQFAGHLMEPVEGMYPPRYRVSTFPSAEQLKSIGLCDHFKQTNDTTA